MKIYPEKPQLPGDWMRFFKIEGAEYGHVRATCDFCGEIYSWDDVIYGTTLDKELTFHLKEEHSGT